MGKDKEDFMPTPELIEKMDISLKNAHQRLDNLDEFIVEIRAMNSNMAKMNDNVLNLTKEVHAQGGTLLKVVDDVVFLKKSSDNHATVDRIHCRIDGLEKRGLEIKSENKFIKHMQIALSICFVALFIILVISIV
jgi:uncharacterized protein (UPF0335 family)